MLRIRGFYSFMVRCLGDVGGQDESWGNTCWFVVGPKTVMQQVCVGEPTAVHG